MRDRRNLRNQYRGLVLISMASLGLFFGLRAYASTLILNQIASLNGEGRSSNVRLYSHYSVSIDEKIEMKYRKMAENQLRCYVRSRLYLLKMIDSGRFTEEYLKPFHNYWLHEKFLCLTGGLRSQDEQLLRFVIVLQLVEIGIVEPVNHQTINDWFLKNTGVSVDEWQPLKLETILNLNSRDFEQLWVEEQELERLIEIRSDSLRASIVSRRPAIVRSCVLSD